jgi:hypothetical protein
MKATKDFVDKVISCISGSGLDFDFDVNESKSNYIIKTYYHELNDMGYYCGIDPITIYISKHDAREFTVHGSLGCTHRFYELDILSYLYDLVDSAIMEVCNDSQN